MHKIFKYSYSPATQEASLPLSARVIRIDHVDDGFYKGDFVWAIVETGEPNVPQKLTLSPAWGWDLSEMEKVQLAVKEKQEIECANAPVYAHEDDGKIYAYCPRGTPPQKYQIAVFKTGQEMDIHPDRLIYLGLNRLWIIQELGLYTFLVTP